MSELDTHTDTELKKDEVTTHKTNVSALTILAWIFGIIFLFAGLINFFTKPVTGLFEILAGLSIFPPFWKTVKTKWGYGLRRAYKVVLCIVLLLISGAAYGQSTTSSNAGKQTTATTENTTGQNNDSTSKDTPTITPTEAPTDTPKPTLTPQQIIANFEKDAQTITVADIYKSPNSYKGKSLIFTCSVSGFPKDENGDVGALNCDDPNAYGSNVQIGISKETDVTKINENDLIKVYGLGAGAMQGKNAFGGDITTGGIVGLYINDLTTGYKNY
jgi:hypothetical protein